MGVGVVDEKMVDKRIIVALDFADSHSCLALLDQLDPTKCRVKVGKELFTYCGPDLVKSIINQGFDVFLDLKFHDIPNTVAGAVSAAADLGVWMVNVHASGGRAMMVAARSALAGDGSPILIAVTVLTSMSGGDLIELGVSSTPQEQVLKLASLTADCGLDGVVCSAHEASVLRLNMPTDFCLVTPGIRPAGDQVGDQKRVATPASAIALGSDYLVIGRPVTQAQNPSQKLESIIKEISASE